MVEAVVVKQTQEFTQDAAVCVLCVTKSQSLDIYITLDIYKLHM